MLLLRPHGLGEAGRGFAVVADEVRALSNRSTQFSDVIKQQMERIKQQIDTLTQEIRELASQDTSYTVSAKAAIQKELDAIIQKAQSDTQTTQQLERVSGDRTWWGLRSTASGKHNRQRDSRT